MLTFFPIPYPDEWWYSVLCRYFIRSGYFKYATTRKELYNTSDRISGERLFPNLSIYRILQNIPAGVLSSEEILLNHTLLPYYMRFYPSDKKNEIFHMLSLGKAIPKTVVRLSNSNNIEEGLKYCPECYHQDKELYGEAYWHREHQIPLMAFCPKHKIKLIKYPCKFQRMTEAYLPLNTINASNIKEYPDKKWEESLSDFLMDILLMDYFKYGITEGYNNLEQAMFNNGLVTERIRHNLTLDVGKCRSAILDFYGKEIFEKYFTKLTRYMLKSITCWNTLLPERYALLSVLVDLSAKNLMGPPIPKYYDEKLALLSQFLNDGKTYTKTELAKKIGISVFQLNSLAKKYDIYL